MPTPPGVTILPVEVDVDAVLDATVSLLSPDEVQVDESGRVAVPVSVGDANDGDVNVLLVRVWVAVSVTKVSLIAGRVSV